VENLTKLTKISQTVTENANREAEDIIETAEKLKISALEAEKAHLDEETAAYILEETAKIKNEAGGAVVMANLECKRNLLAERNEYIQKISDAVLEKLKAFAAGEEYAGWFEEGYRKVHAVAGGEGIIKIRKEDEPLLKKIAPGREYEISGEIKIGGFILESRTRLLDLTLDTKFRNEMDRFVCVGAFIIDK